MAIDAEAFIYTTEYSWYYARNMENFIRLRDLARVIQAFGNKSSKALFLPNKKNTQIRQLARKFVTPGIARANERAWAKEILGKHVYGQAYRESDQGYIRLRSHLRRQLLARLFHLHIRTGSEYRKALYRTMQEVFWIRVLILFGARKAAIWLVPQALERATKFELTDERIQLLRILRFNAMYSANRTKFARYSQELKQAERVREAEQKLRDYDEAISMEAVERVEMTEKGVALAQAALIEAQPIFAEYPTYNVGLEYYRIATLAAEGSANIPELLRLCDDAQRFLSRFPHITTPLTEGQFIMKRFGAAVGLREFSAGNELIPECERCFPMGTPNWFVWKQVEMLLRLHGKKYSEASELHHVVTQRPIFLSQPEQVTQKWEYFGGYAALALWSEDRTQPMPNFEKILREVPIYKRDKIGFNASLLILQMLIVASLRDRNAMYDKGDSLRQYVKRNLRHKKKSRVYAFFRTMIILIENDLDVAQTERQARRYIKRFYGPPTELVDEKESYYYPDAWDTLVGDVSRMKEAERLKKEAELLEEMPQKELELNTTALAN